MANARFYLKEKNTNNETLILMFFNYNNKVFKYSTKTSIHPRNWNNKICRVKKQSSHSLELNKQINNIENSIMKIYLRMKTNDRVVNNKVLKEQLDISLNREEKEDFFDYIKLYIEQKSELKKTTKSDYLQTYNTLKKFEKQSSYIVSFDSITLDFYNRFKKFIINDLDHSINTFGKRIKTIKSIMNYATEIGINKNLAYQKSAFKVLNEKPKRIYLTKDEITILKELNLSDSLENARDAFLLMCYLGLRFSDYHKINQNSISNGFLDIIMHKTDESISIPIHPYALEIIKKYNYVLPKTSNGRLNKMIKKVCNYAEIDNDVIDKGEIKKKYQLVTCHTARRSFATNGYLSDVPVRDLMRIIGHKKESTFLDYVQVKREVKLSRILEIYPTKLSRVG